MMMMTELTGDFFLFQATMLKHIEARGVLPEKVGGAVCGPLPKTLTLFMTKICMLRNSLPYL